MNAGKRARRVAAAARKKTNEQRRQANGPRVTRHGTRHGALHGTRHGKGARAQGKKAGHKGWGVVGDSEMADYFQTISDEAETLRIAQFEYGISARFEHWIRKHFECGSLEHKISICEYASLVCGLLAKGRRDRKREKKINEKPTFVESGCPIFVVRGCPNAQAQRVPF